MTSAGAKHSSLAPPCLMRVSAAPGVTREQRVDLVGDRLLELGVRLQLGRRELRREPVADELRRAREQPTETYFEAWREVKIDGNGRAEALTFLTARFAIVTVVKARQPTPTSSPLISPPSATISLP